MSSRPGRAGMNTRPGEAGRSAPPGKSRPRTHAMPPLSFALAAVRERRTAFAGSLVALSLGVAILCASVLILLSGGSGVPDRYAGSPVLVQAPKAASAEGAFVDRPPWSPERTRELTRTLGALPGVRQAVPDRAFAAQAVREDGRPLDEQQAGERRGHAWAGAALAPYALTSGRGPRGPQEVVVPSELGRKPGERISLLTARGTQPHTVSGTVEGRGYYLTDTRAAALSGGVRVIGLLLDAGADPATVAAAASKTVGTAGAVLTGDARDALAPVQDEKTRWIGAQVLAAMAALSGFVTVFVVSSTFAFGVTQRRRELGLLRTLGATPKQLRRMLYAEALCVGAVGAAAGAVLGALLAPALGTLLVDTGFQPEGFEVRQALWVPPAAWAAGLGVALAGVWSAARRAARIAPLEALREAAVDDRPLSRGRLLTGLGLTALGCGAAVASASAEPTDMITLALGTAVGLITGVTLLTPALLPPLVRLVTLPLVRYGGPTALLVREGVRTAVRRTASTVAPVLATLGFVVLITGNTQTSAQSYRTEEAVSIRAEAAVVPDGTPGLSDAIAARIEGAALLPTTLHTAAGPLTASGVDPAAFTAAHPRLTLVSGSLAALDAPGTIAVTESVRRALPSGFTFEDGRTERLRVVAVLADRSAPYQALLSRATVRAHDPSALTEAVYRTGPATLPPGTREMAVALYAGRADAEEDRLVEIFTLLLVAMSAGYTGIAIANTLLMATTDRLGDFRVLRLSGAAPRQVLGAVAGETVLVVALGTLLGGLVALPSLLGIRAGLSGTLGIPVELVIPWTPVLGAVGGCLLLALTASVLPARGALRAAAA
ncbi:FtsX-like permease family protein [Streptomyces sp. NPDC051561]|uniref:ABC transporter permease n=1 Tax=Streptomyces sp. NPDC051561 TaxID=3365658 RepID=UPI0037AFA258